MALGTDILLLPSGNDEVTVVLGLLESVEAADVLEVMISSVVGSVCAVDRESAALLPPAPAPLLLLLLWVGVTMVTSLGCVVTACTDTGVDTGRPAVPTDETGTGGQGVGQEEVVDMGGVAMMGGDETAVTTPPLVPALTVTEPEFTRSVAVSEVLATELRV